MRNVAITLGVAAAGALAATGAGLPAAPLLGAAAAVTAFALAGGAARIPDPMREIAFAAIGVALGAGIGPGFLADAARWPLSLAALAAVIAVTILVSSVLMRRSGMEAGTALLAVAPGALSVALSLSEGTGRDTRTVATLQAVRLLALTVVLPPVLTAASGTHPAASGPSAVVDTGYLAGAVLLAAAMLAGRLGVALRVPAPHLLAGFALSGAAHAGGALEGPLPAPAAFAAFAVAGAVIGTRFRGVTVARARRLLGPAIGLTALATAIAAVAAALVAPALEMPFGQVMIAFAPGGVETMAAMALFLGHDPVYVSVHHVARILALIVTLPWLLARLPAPAEPPGGPHPP